MFAALKKNEANGKAFAEQAEDCERWERREGSHAKAPKKDLTQRRQDAKVGEVRILERN